MLECGKKMLRRVAVDNQENGRREFTSKHVACALGANPEELGLWSRLDLDHDHGVALTATLAKQSGQGARAVPVQAPLLPGGAVRRAPAAARHGSRRRGPGWEGWATDKAAAEFLNNRYMNNTCRIAAGHLGSLLAKQRAHWDFRERRPLTPNGRSALWFITDENDKVSPSTSRRTTSRRTT